MIDMRPLMRDIQRCVGITAMTEEQDHEICKERDTCRRYLSWQSEKLVDAFVSVGFATKNCTSKIEIGEA